MLRNRVNGCVLAEDVVSPLTGEVVAEKGTKITARLLTRSRIRRLSICG